MAVALSIVVVSWNARNYLIQCLESIARTTEGLCTETIVFDNGSTDGSVDAVRAKFPWVAVSANSENIGFSRACNAGIRQSQGKYVCLVNSDVVIRDGCFRILYEFMEQHPEVGMVGPKMLGPDLATRRSTMGFPTVTNNLSRALALDSIFPRSRLFGEFLMAYREFSAVRNVDILNGFFWMLRRKALDSVGLLDEGFFFYGEDIDLCRRFAEKGCPRVYHPGAAAVHYGGASSARQPLRFFLEMQRANLQYWRKHNGASGEFEYFLILVINHGVRLAGYSLKLVFSRGSGSDLKYKILRSRRALGWLAGRLVSGFST